MRRKFRFAPPSVPPVRPQTGKAPDERLNEPAERLIPASLEQTTATICDLLGNSGNFIVRSFRVFGAVPAVLFYFSDLSDQTIINRFVLEPLMQTPRHLEGKHVDPDRLKQVLADEALVYAECYLERRLDHVIEAILEGRIATVVEGVDEAFIIGSPLMPKRVVEQPPTEQVIQGPREGFIEPLITNLGLIRYRLPTSSFRVSLMRIGRLTKTKVAVCHLEGIAQPWLIDEVKRRIGAIDIDGVLDAGYVEQFIEDNHWSPFPQIQSTEKPDRAVAQLLEGRVVILVDGSPFALIAPSVFVQFYQSSEDYSSRFLQGSFSRLARVVALVFSLVTPALYVAIISFNPELIPTEFAVAVAGGRAGVPFPAAVEVLLLEISMEVLREATVRLPQQVGGALSIVGVLVVGQAAVAAGFASPITVVVIALTTIGSFATPAYNAAFTLRMLRFPMILLAGMFGLYGIVIGLIIIGNHTLSLTSFGVPYLTPASPGNWQGMKDLITRAPLWSMKKRPNFLQPIDPTRVGSGPANTKRWSDETVSGNHGDSDDSHSR